MRKALYVVLTVGIILAPTTAAHPRILGGSSDECQFGQQAERIVRCAARRFDPPGGISKAVSVWSCESGFAVEGPHSDPYHGPFQYLRSTFRSQYESIPHVTRWFHLKKRVHNPRSNIVVAVAWAARHGWGPWSCA